MHRLPELERIRAWLTHIGETDPAIIDAILEDCRRDPEAIAYYLSRAEELSSVRDRAAAMLETDPSLQRAMVADDGGDPIRIGLAIRGIGAAELLVPAGKYDGLDLLELWRRHTEGAT